MHFCADELMAITASLPFLGVMVRKAHAWWHKEKCQHMYGPYVGHNPDPVRYVTMDEAMEIAGNPKSDSYSSVTGPGWYFCDETWSQCYGPYKTEKECRAQLLEYCKTL